MKRGNRFFSKNLQKIKHTIFTLANFLLHTPFLLALAAVFIIDHQLAHGVVSGKYFWFYGSMGLVSIATFVHSIINKQSFRFSLTDGFVFFFAGSVFLPAWLSGDVSVNSTKLTLLALLVVLYFCLRCMFQGIAGQARNDRKQKQGIAGQARNDRKQEQGDCGSSPQ